MKLPWIRSRPCDRVRDQLLSDGTSPGAVSVSPEAREHLEGCPDCRELADALSMVGRMGPAWQTSEPPPGLVQHTLTFLEPHWPRAERPLHRHEVRILWSGGLAMAGAAAAVGLILLDRIFPVASGVSLEHLFRLGIRVAVIQLIGGAVISIFLLALKTARTARGNSHRPASGRGREGDKS